MATGVRVLLLDDNTDSLAVARSALGRDFPDLEVIEVSTREMFEQWMAAGDFDLVITDYRLGWADGIDVLLAVKKRCAEVPVIMFTGAGNEEVAVAGLKAGLDDYVVKAPGHLARLSAAVENALVRREGRQAVRRAEALYRRLLEGLPVGLYRTDLEGRVLEVNPALLRLLGHPDAASLVGTHAARWYADPRDHARWKGEMERLGLLNGFEVEFRRRDGASVWVRESARAIRDETGRVACYEGVIEDCTERIRAEEALRQRERQFRTLIENSSDLILILDRQGRLRYVGPSVHRILGYEPAELIGRDFFDYVHPDDRARGRTAFDHAFERPGAPGSVELRVRHHGGSWRVLEALAGGFADETGRVSAVANARDVTERRAAEDALRQSEEQLLQAKKMEAVGRLAGGVAHDFNNVLTAVTGYADLLLERLGPSDDVRPPIEEIRKAADRAVQLTRQLLAFSRKQVLRPRVLDLNGVVSGLEPMLRRTIGEDIGFDVKLDPEPWLVKVDRTQMEQVILNLAVNARDAMPEGGRLAIETQKVQILPEDASRYPDAPPGCYAVLTVSDTGVGMSPEILSHVFEPFFTTKEPGKGTGLGLSTVYGIVRQSNGHVWVESEPLRGTTFRICLPRAEGKAEPITTVIPVIPPAKGSETVLLVEDADVVRKLAHEVLRRNGYKVIEATDGRTAVDLAARHAGPIHLLLTDLVMPEMSGRQLANYLAAARPDLRILYMSGYAEDAVARQGRIDPGAAFVPKPFTPADLARKVRETLDAPRRS